MDSYDAADLPQYWQTIENQKKVLENAHKFKGQHMVPKKSRYQIIFQFQMRLMMRQGSRLGPNNAHIGSTFIPPSYVPCIKPLCDLKKVMIRDLLVETHHRDMYLLLRTITPPDRMSAIMAVAEDEIGNVAMLQLYQQPKETERFAEEILGEESVVIVKEPYLKIMGDGDYGIRVDHLSDILFLPNHDSRVPRPWRRMDIAASVMNADDWKIKGNNYFKESNYFQAIECYTNALSDSPTEEEADTIKTNRSLAFLKTGQLDAALSDTASTPKNPSTANKAIYRRARALYELQRYEESYQLFRTLSLDHADNGDVKQYLNRVVKRLEEQKSGKYPFTKLYQQAESLRPPHLDCATYVGPVEIRQSGPRGRGLFTTAAVKAGDLLLCEKAFAHSFMDEKDTKQDISMMFSLETGKGFMGAQPDLMQMIAQKLYRNPSVAANFTDLYHGAYEAVNFDSIIDSKPVVDTFLIERVISLNSFGCPISSRATLLKEELDEMPQMKKESDKELFHSCGIWAKASYINHFCLSNARRTFIGDMMMVRATSNLEPDTEVTFWYYPPFPEKYEEIRKKMVKSWGFSCDCALCEDSRATKADVHQKRNSIRAALLKLMSPGGRVKIARVETLMASLETTYNRPASEIPRLSVWDALLNAAQICMHHNQPKKAAEFALRSLESLGYIIEGGVPGSSSTKLVIKKWGYMVDDLIACWLLLADAYLLVAPRLESQARNYARTTYKICVGEDETFEETCVVWG